MSQTVISVEHLSKSYRLGQIGTGTLTNDLKVWWAKKTGKPNPMLKIGQTDHGNMDGKTLWALKDVSFQVEQGEVLGIIGRNGAGKSTLLKILSRVTAPTSGVVKVKGRIASLLEVGTGFHPDLTGRENIYLNGAILGMTKQEIARKFDEIVDFAEIEKFIDTPVKRYSSGMYVRLAFAVAAHLESEILLVDEVLAVGDAEFQKKCLGKMGDVASKEGRTVLFVSHNMGSIITLCRKGLLFGNGAIEKAGSIKNVVDFYTENIRPNSEWQPKRPRKDCTNRIKIIGTELSTPNKYGGFLTMTMQISAEQRIERFSVEWFITNKNGQRIVSGLSALQDGIWFSLKNQNEIGIIECILENWLFPGGIYSLSVMLTIPNIECFDYIEDSVIFEVPEMIVKKTGFIFSSNYGLVLPPVKWRCIKNLQMKER